MPRSPEKVASDIDALAQASEKDRKAVEHDLRTPQGVEGLTAVIRNREGILKKGMRFTGKIVKYASILALVGMGAGMAADKLGLISKITGVDAFSSVARGGLTAMGALGNQALSTVASAGSALWNNGGEYARKTAEFAQNTAKTGYAAAESVAKTAAASYGAGAAPPVAPPVS